MQSGCQSYVVFLDDMQESPSSTETSIFAAHDERAGGGRSEISPHTYATSHSPLAKHSLGLMRIRPLDKTCAMAIAWCETTASLGRRTHF